MSVLLSCVPRGMVSNASCVDAAVGKVPSVGDEVIYKPHFRNRCLCVTWGHQPATCVGPIRVTSHPHCLSGAQVWPHSTGSLGSSSGLDALGFTSRSLAMASHRTGGLLSIPGPEHPGRAREQLTQLLIGWAGEGALGGCAHDPNQLHVRNELQRKWELFSLRTAHPGVWERVTRHPLCNSSQWRTTWAVTGSGDNKIQL